MSATPTFRRASIGEILLAVRAKLADTTGLPLGRVGIVAAEPNDVPHFNADSDVLIRNMSERREPGYLEGHGRLCDLRDATVHVYGRSRSYLDQAGSDLERITNATVGHIKLMDAIADALEIFAAEDKDENVLNMPIYLDGPSTAEKDREDPNWVSSYFTLQIPYQRILNQATQ